MVVVFIPESGGIFVLKLILDIEMDLDDIVLLALTHSLQNLHLKDASGDNVLITASYFKDALLILQNCLEFSTNSIGLINDIYTLLTVMLLLDT